MSPNATLDGLVNPTTSIREKFDTLTFAISAWSKTFRKPTYGVQRLTNNRV